MKPERDVDALVERHLKEDAPPLPPSVRAAVRDRVSRTSQLGAQGRFGSAWSGLWTGGLRLAAAGLVIVVVVGLSGFLGLGPLAPGERPTGSVPLKPTESPNATVAPPRRTPLLTPSIAGLWSTTDVDGSQMTLTVVASGGLWAVTFVDVRASACAGPAVVSHGAGTFTDNKLVADMTGGCEGQPPGDPARLAWTYDPPTDTFHSPADGPSGQLTLTWHRGSGAADAFSQTWTFGTAADAWTLAVQGDTLEKTVAYTQPNATTCGGQTFNADGTGSVGSQVGRGRFLTVQLSGGCPGAAAPIQWQFEYHVETDTLLGPLSADGLATSLTVSWTR